MRTYRPLRHALVAVVILGLLTAVALLPVRADALVRMTPAVALWRILAHEASLPRWDEESETWVSRHTGRPWGDDVYLLHEVLLRGSERTGMTYVGFTQAYANRMFLPLTDVERTRIALGLPLDGNRWAGFLQEDLSRPDAWASSSANWTRWRDGAEYALELATDVVQYDLTALEEFSQCEAPVDDWGSPRLDHERAVRIGLVPVDCGPNVVNAGYARPSQIRARALSDHDELIED